MIRKTYFLMLLILNVLFLIQFSLSTAVLAQEIPAYDISDLVAGKIQGIQVQMIGSSMSNLGFMLRVTYIRTDSFDIYIPAGILFRPPAGLALEKQLSKPAGGQGGISLFASYYRMPGGGRPTSLPKPASPSFTEDILIYAVCYDVNLPPPDMVNPYTPSMENLAAIPRFATMFNAFENFQTTMYRIDSKVKTYQKLTEDETRHAYFINWCEDDYSQNRPYTLLKSGSQGKRLIKDFTPFDRTMKKTNASASAVPEMSRFDAQNVVWAMVPENDNFSPKGVVSDIQTALTIEGIDTLDNYMRQANNFLELLHLDRRLYVHDSLTVPINYDIYYPPYYIISWNGNGAGFAVRISQPADVQNENINYYLKEVSYYIQADNPGTFQAAILSSVAGYPGVDLIPRKLVRFNALPYGDRVTVDVSSNKLKIEDDFFIALIQTTANTPNAVLTEAINGRSFGFNLVNWDEEQFSLFFTATLTKEIIVNVQPTPTPKITAMKLHQNYPNPFNQQTLIQFDLTQSAHVILDIVNINGQKVRTLVNQEFAPGDHRTLWDGTNDGGLPLTSGVYFIQLKTSANMQIIKTILLQ